MIRNERNMGFPSGNNQGAEVATGQYLCFLNNDCEVYEGWLEQLLNASRDVDLVGTALCYLDPDHKNRVFIFKGITTHSRDWVYLEGWCLLTKKLTFITIGGFDTRFDPYLSEDADLSFRYRSNGFKLKKVLNPRVKHFGNRTINLIPKPQVHSMSDRNRRKLYQKYFEISENCKILIRLHSRLPRPVIQGSP
jgi:GT2 family glycosyltransferase